MEIVLLEEERYESFAMNHPNYNLYQTSSYGNLMNKHGYNAYYLGLANEAGIVNAATMVLVKKEKGKNKMAYCPRGFLIDWNNKELVKEFTDKLKDFLGKRKFTFLKVDPLITYKEHDKQGNDINSSSYGDEFIKYMQSIGYIHLGFNKGFEANKPRWNALNELNPNIQIAYNQLSKETRSKIVSAINYGCKVYKGSANEISILYSLMGGQTKLSLEYFLDYYEYFSPNNNFEIYFTKLEPVTFVNYSKSMYEQEESRNNELNNQIQRLDISNKDALISQKMESDSLLAKYKKDMVEAINLFQTYSEGIIVAGTIVIKNNSMVTFIADGINKEFEKYYPSYILKWNLIQNYINSGYKLIDLNGITGDFSPLNTLNNFKLEFANKVIEYVGEFDLVIDKKVYYTSKSINPILNWLNTPI